MSKNRRIDQFSTLERAWASASKKKALTPKRVVRYNPDYGMFYHPTSYSEASLDDSDASIPDKTWILEGLQSFVLGDPSAKPARGTCPPVLEGLQIENETISEEFIRSLAEETERDYIHGTILPKIVYGSEASPAEKTHAILCDPIIGSKKNERLFPVDLTRKWVEVANKNEVPLQIVVPAFPFKDQNPFRTLARPDHVDLGEVMLLTRMFVLALALQQVIAYGAEWIVLSDGLAYSRIFDVEDQEVKRYSEHLRSFRNRLNFQQAIHLLDLLELTGRMSNFETLRFAIRQSLADLFQHDPDFQGTRDSLARGLRWNLNTRKFLKTFSWEELWHALNSANEQGLAARERELFGIIDEESKKSAIDYASFNLTMKRLRVPQSHFPSSVRATSHPKPGQIALPLGANASNLYPWNGTAWVQGTLEDINSIHTLELYKILRSNPTKMFHLHGSSEPFYFSS